VAIAFPQEIRKRERHKAEKPRRRPGVALFLEIWILNFENPIQPHHHVAAQRDIAGGLRAVGFGENNALQAIGG
jgi:hypothetical protein